MTKKWIIEKDGKKYIRIGINKHSFYKGSLYNHYDVISPKSLASSTKSVEIESEPNHKRKKYSIDSFDIECDKTKLWIDLYYIIETEYDKSDNEIILDLRTGKDVFFYNPSTKKWWGKPYNNGQVAKRLMFSDLYDTKKTLSELRNLYSYEVVGVKEFFPKIINKRTLTLPSSKYYSDKLSALQAASSFYDMYVEKEEIAPKDEDE